MSRLASLFILTLSLSLGACTGGDGNDSGGRRQFLAGDGTCDNPEQVCLETYPPQCYDVCPGDPGDGDDCDEPVPNPEGDDGDVTVTNCDGDDCIISIDTDGNEVIICPGDDCSVSYDAETGETRIECPDDPGCGGGSEPGNPGDGGDGTDPVEPQDAPRE